jgi:hypothetical protein
MTALLDASYEQGAFFGLVIENRFSKKARNLSRLAFANFFRNFQERWIQ